MGHNICFIVGHYGSGKTEFALNYALKLRRSGRETAIADLDIVNPYFRSREKAALLQKEGIRVVSNNLDNEWRIDLPALSSELESFFIDSGRANVIDVGGDAVGARVLARFHDHIAEGSYDMWLVVNANRFGSRTAEQNLPFARTIMAESGLRLTGVVSDTHMLCETMMEDILRGGEVVGEVCRQLGLPCVYTVCPESLLAECEQQREKLPGELFPIQLYMRPDYLDER